ncbi:MAG: thioredoxin family protein [Cyclobacteriaceae bacterium]
MKITKNIFLICALFSSLSLMANGYEVGDYTSDFKLKNVDGKMVSLSDYEDARGFILIFTCNTCPYAQKYEQRIIELHEKFSQQGFPVIAINPNDPGKSSGDAFDLMKARAKEKDFPFPYLQDQDQTIAQKYGATRTPEVYLLAKHDDKFKLIYTGAIDDNYSDASKVSTRYIAEAINQYTAGKEVKEKATKAIGCTIKWKS